MAWFKRLFRFKILVIILTVALMLGFLVKVPTRVAAQSRTSSLSNRLASAFRPPAGTGTPVNRQGAATRRPTDEARKCIPGGKSLVALVPVAGGKTLAEYPTIYWYMPETTASELEFVLRDMNLKDVYRVKYSLSKSIKGVLSTPGIKSITVPVIPNLSGLQVGQEYYWGLGLVCNSQDRSKDIVAEGWIERVEPDRNLALRVRQATPQERVALYADAGLWYEALATLVEVRRDRPNDKDLAEAWKTLFDSVELEIVSSESVN